MSARTEPMRLIAAAELRAALSGRVVQALGGLFAALALGVSIAGLGASGQLLVQGFARTGLSVLMLALYLLPLVGLVTGAGAFGAEHGGTELLLAQPVSRRAVLLGRALGLAGAVAAIAIVGFGVAGVVVGVAAGTAGLGGYLLVTALSMVVGLTGLAAGILIGVLVRRRATAVGAALAAWLCIAVLYDLAAIAILQFVGSGEPGGLLVGLLALNPIDGARALALVALGADVLLGPTGAAVSRLLGAGGGTALILVTLVAWCVLPLGLARVVYDRRDF